MHKLMGRPFAEVVLDLGRYQVSVQTLEPEIARCLSEQYEILAIATQFINMPCVNLRAPQLKYLQSSRQLGEKQSSFNLGCSSWLETLYRYCRTNKTLLSPTGRKAASIRRPTTSAIA